MYDVDSVRKALPLIWHDTYLLGEGDALPPDPDMPRASTKDPHSGEKILAIRVDMQRAYEAVGMDHIPFLFLRYGLGFTYSECEDALSTPDSSLYEIDDMLITSMTNYLNGDMHDDLYTA